MLKKLNRETWEKMNIPRMLSGHLQGRTLSMISKMVKPKLILEIGTFTGYSALCLAEGLHSEGRLITIDKNEELEEIVKRYLSESTLGDKIDFVIGNAIEEIEKLDVGIDLVFIDADKENYLNYYKMVLPKLNPDGLIIADNVLWSGKVVKDKKNPDADTKGLLDFNEFIQNDARVENLLLPVRDGLMIVRKIEDS